MKIGCLQFAPRLGEVDQNVACADRLLEQADHDGLDLLVLPEMAFSGYNFQSLEHIAPFLEPTTSGVSTSWAQATARKLNCPVIVGYPERAGPGPPRRDADGPATTAPPPPPPPPPPPERYNSAVIVGGDGEVRGNYRKSHLYYTDETWALEGPGFYADTLQNLGQVTLGICMDINPYKFEAPWDVYEYATHALGVKARVVIVSMAWLTSQDASSFAASAPEPDMDTLTYWVSRIQPLVRLEGEEEEEEEVVVVFANRCGIEGSAVYAGTSAVLGVRRGEITVYGLMGRAKNGLMVADTGRAGSAKLVYRRAEAAGAE